jgi:hypothetical protein
MTAIVHKYPVFPTKKGDYFVKWEAPRDPRAWVNHQNKINKAPDTNYLDQLNLSPI